MARLSSALLASATFAAAATAQQCVASQTECAADSSLLMTCQGSTWVTARCPTNQYCMTMMPGMVHCMLQPANVGPTASSTPTPTPSSTSTPTHPSSSDSSDSSDSKNTHSGAAANKVAAVGLSVVVVALVALF
ncbi:hypothetical protein IWW38_002127 [Coemansia aciculifera]|uniref:Uncharacterized protein n=1 Tax=Coemansia aciculifera TaxID=417176 RepID=A0ACC1M597_9FUNG|nr:hypothetical protein IWW38_002127 [Coemansia aciculifera]